MNFEQAFDKWKKAADANAAAEDELFNAAFHAWQMGDTLPSLVKTQLDSRDGEGLPSMKHAVIIACTVERSQRGESAPLDPKQQQIAEYRDKVRMYETTLKTDGTGMYAVALRRDRDKALLEIAKLEGDEVTAAALQVRVNEQQESMNLYLKSLGYGVTRGQI